MKAVGLPNWDDVFFNAALEPDRWPEALAEMARHTGSSHGQLLGVGGAREIPFNIANDFAPSIPQDFIAIGGASPALNYRIAACNTGIARGDYDGVLHEAHYAAEMPLLESDRYARWCEDIDIPYGCQTNLVVDRVGLVGLALLRKRKDGPTNAQQRARFARAATAARRAVRLQERLEGDQARLLAGAFDAISATAFIIDAVGRVSAMTRNAEQLVADGSIGLRDRYLAARGIPLSLAQCVSALVAEDGLDHVRLRVDCPGSRPPLFLEGFRLPRRDWSLGHLPHAILLIKPPQHDRAGIAAFLAALYRLTDAEADIAIRLHDGLTRQEIADLRDVATETLRGQIKMICAKTDSRNEAGLMRILNVIMA